MTAQGHSMLLSLVVIGLTAVLTLPLVVAFVRDIDGKLDVVLLGFVLGWTGVAWVCAMFLAMTRPACRRHVEHVRAPSSIELPNGTYANGVYLISSGPDSHTWAQHRDGRWRIMYEVAGVDRLVGDVVEADVPLSVLAQALRPTSPRR
jgi:hypothetical protein